MSLETMLLAGAALVLLAAVLTMRELPLMLGIAFYAGNIVWLVWHDMSLLLPSLGGGIAIGLVALVQIIRREAGTVTQEVPGDRYIPSQQITNKSVHI